MVRKNEEKANMNKTLMKTGVVMYSPKLLRKQKKF